MVTDDQLMELVGSTVDGQMEPFTLTHMQVVSSSDRNRVASVSVKIIRQVLKASTRGQGKARLKLSCSALDKRSRWLWISPIWSFIRCPQEKKQLEKRKSPSQWAAKLTKIQGSTRMCLSR